MPYEMKVDGMAEVSEMLAQLEERAPKAAAKALYTGAGIMAQEILKEMGKVKTAPFEYAKNGEKRLPSPEEKEALMQAGVGVAKFSGDGTEIDTSVGFNQSGYVRVNFRHMNANTRTNYKLANGKNVGAMKAKLLKMNKSGDQKPIGVIANSINSGTSFMQKQPFVRKAASSGGKKAMAAMKEAIEKELEALTKN